MMRGNRMASRMVAGLLGIAMLLGTAAAESSDCDHTYVKKEIPADCTNTGVVYYECTKCGDQYGHESTPALGHDFGTWETVVPAACETEGREKRACSRCEAEETRALAALGHAYQEHRVEPTCTKGGYIEQVCTRCDERRRTEDLPARGHQYEVAEVVKPTCTKEGYTLKRCSVCGDEEKTDHVSATGHKYEVAEVVKPTCTKDGYTLKRCSVCGDEEKTDHVSATGHQ